MLKKRKEFFQKINKFEKQDYLDSFLIYLLSPIITGIKPSATITLTHMQGDRFRYLYEKELSNENFEYLRIRRCEKKELIMIYNKKSLIKYLSIEENKKLLEGAGYSGMSIEEMFEELRFRIITEEFPHEIGLFLGIPACDVKGFLNCKKCIHSRYWKVYDNLEIANELFDLYDSSRDIVINDTLKGVPLEKTIYSMKNMYLKNVDILQ
ncbi:MAG: DUF3793 family protein [Andreesenia angusta]|nr:DUF3793 family protein [Andreesenia angusta]